MATEAPTEAPNLPHPPFPLSDLGPRELSCFHSFNPLYLSKLWVFWSRYNDELRHHRHLHFDSKIYGEWKHKIKLALQGLGTDYFIGACLVQFWGLVNIEDNRYLTICDQPFALVEGRFMLRDVERLCRHRKHSLQYLIAVDGPRVVEGELGPPGRVFRSGSPEIVHDANSYSWEEHPQCNPAIEYNMSYWALPVYQSPGNICIGVLEFLSPEYYYYFPWTKYQNWLKMVGLTTNCPVSLPDYQKSSSCHKKEINEIEEAARVLRNTYQICGAQMWIEANSEELLTVLYHENYGPLDGFCFIQKGHGVVGKAFSSQSACFCRDVRQLSIAEHPIANARKYRYASCFAICLRSSCSNSCIYTLEFGLPTNEINCEDARTLLHVIMEILKQHLRSSFKVACGQELGQNLFVEVIKVSSDDKLDSFRICHASSGESTPRVIEVQNQVGMIPPDGSYQQVDVVNNFVRDNNAQQNVIEELDATLPTRDDVSTEHNDSEATSSRIGGSAYTLESARGITLKDLQQRSAMKLVDAAKDLGVSRSTLKRICRGHGIHRWPPHKARKCNHAIDQQEFAQPSKKNIEAHLTSVATRVADDSNIMVKATYGDDTIKFQVLLSAKKTDLEDKVAKRLNLPVGSFRIKFLDEDDEWILVTCDEDLSTSLRMLRSLGKTTVRISVNQYYIHELHVL